ncbi:hypothetical protein CDEST_14387 [Colletotrichum destructivum]|uniref:Uncharacterized protein n=1 Tax=Colletotrichum destructivum TaxID=34406 RepID=A0AAX4J1U7_9PEZI|nr:hypothetical protein CDEST_14387 [Colletotrichum destructivum]
MIRCCLVRRLLSAVSPAARHSLSGPLTGRPSGDCYKRQSVSRLLTSPALRRVCHIPRSTPPPDPSTNRNMNPDVPPSSDPLDKLHRKVREHVDEAMRTMPLDPEKSLTLNAFLILLHLLAMLVNIAKDFADQAGSDQMGADEIAKLFKKNGLYDTSDFDSILKYAKLLKIISGQLDMYLQDLRNPVDAQGSRSG